MLQDEAQKSKKGYDKLGVAGEAWAESKRAEQRAETAPGKYSGQHFREGIFELGFEG